MTKIHWFYKAMQREPIIIVSCFLGFSGARGPFRQVSSLAQMLSQRQVLGFKGLRLAGDPVGQGLGFGVWGQGSRVSGTQGK